MSESQKREAKRLFEILKEKGHIELVPKYDIFNLPKIHNIGKFLQMYLETEEEWIQVLTEAIAIYQAEKLGKLMIKRQVQDRKAKE